MSGIPSDTHIQLRETLLNCGPFASHNKLKAIFVEARIRPWRDRLPEADNAADRVETVIEFLYKQSSKTGENALVLFLRILSERLDPGDACHHRLLKLAGTLEQEIAKRLRIFISYKRGVEPDEPIARQVYEALSQDYEVFIDQNILVGAHWVERIESELRRSDFLLVFLSAHSVHSEMVLGEVETAHRLARGRNGKPVILPVRLAYYDPFPYPLSIYLDPINWAFWRDDSHTPRIIKELQAAISGLALPVDDRLKPRIVSRSQQPAAIARPTASAQPLRLESPAGTMNPDSVFYVERAKDQIALDEIKRQGVIVTIKAPRQMGKSSLLNRMIDAAAKDGKRVAFLDFQEFDQQELNEADIFYQRFCSFVSDELDIEDKAAQYWQKSSGNNRRCTRYFEKYLLPQLDAPLVLAMDEVEGLFGTAFQDDFFGMLRSWHNKGRSSIRGRIWKQLDMALVTSTEPNLFVQRRNQSPFNVGERIELTDFSFEQVADLNHRHRSPFNKTQIQQLYALLRGHPYLTRLALYRVAKQELTLAELFQRATDNYHGPFSDHLRYYWLRLQEYSNLMQGLQQIIQHQTCSDEQIVYRLRSAGLVRPEGRSVLPRCQLYADYFREHLHG